MFIPITSDMLTIINQDPDTYAAICATIEDIIEIEKKNTVHTFSVLVHPTFEFNDKQIECINAIFEYARVWLKVSKPKEHMLKIHKLVS